MDIVEKYKEYLWRELNYSPQTIRAYVRDVEFFLSFLGDKSYLDADAKDLRRWMRSLLEQGKSPKTVNRKTASIKKFYKYLYIIKEVGVFPFENVVSVKVAKKALITPSEDEVRRIIERLYEKDDFEGVRNRLVFLFYYLLGIRKTELIEIKVGDLRPTTVRIYGKGRKERDVPLPAILSEEIEVYNRMKEVMGCASDYFFVLKKRKKLTQTFVYNLINSYLGSGLRKEYNGPHALRHSFATHLLDHGANINHVKKLMGHSSLQSTQVYVSHSIEKLKKVYAKAHPKSKK